MIWLENVIVCVFISSACLLASYSHKVQFITGCVFLLAAETLLLIADCYVLALYLLPMLFIFFLIAMVISQKMAPPKRPLVVARVVLAMLGSGWYVWGARSVPRMKENILIYVLQYHSDMVFALFFLYAASIIFLLHMNVSHRKGFNKKDGSAG